MKTIRERYKEYFLNREDLPAAVPGILMCCMYFIVLIADLLIGEMSKKQYLVFPGIFRIVIIMSVLCGIAVIVRRIMESRTGVNAETTLFAGFALCMIISTMINGFSRDAMLGVPIRYLGMPDFLICVLILFGCTKECRSIPLKRLILNLYVLAADCIAVCAVIDHYTDAVAAFRDKEGLSAIFFHGNHYGYFLVMAVLISIGFVICGSGAQRILGSLSMLINLAALGLNQSLGCILAVGMTMMILLAAACICKSEYLTEAAAVTGFLVLIAFAALLLSSSVREDVRQLLFDITTLTSGGNHGYAGHLRWLLWTETSHLIAARPLAGYGCEGIRASLYSLTEVANPHNEVLTYAAFFGIPAAVFYAAGVIAVLFKAFRRTLKGSISGTAAPDTVMPACLAASGYYISALFGVGVFYTLPFFFIVLGLSADFRGDEE